MAYSSFRQMDSRTETFYRVKDGHIIASDRNYCLDLFMPHRTPVVIDGRVYCDEEMTDRTDDIVADLSRYSHYNFTDTPELAFLGEKRLF